MRTIEDIKKNIKSCEKFIDYHKEQIESYFYNMDTRKIIEHSQSIGRLQAELSTLKWVLNESV